ncbi:hypothetical protein AB0D67_36135 [Streptosporangium sp. NPDC048047]|uniref:hypothetical protein n=1 Tax=Streptosporangium sp. NPDC048047 TaxID=3155748 RepID=UPI0034492926
MAVTVKQAVLPAFTLGHGDFWKETMPQIENPAIGRGDSITSPPVIIALSGPDNVGKTTNIRLLSRRCGATVLDPLNVYDPRWPTATDLPAWWFETARVEEVVDVLACSYLARARAARSSPDPFVLVDRGITMLEASIIATIASRSGEPYPRAVEQAHRLLATYAEDISAARTAELEVHLLHHIDPHRGATRALAREQTVTSRYAAYQQMLNRHLAFIRDRDVIVVDDQSIMKVHDAICRHLRSHDLLVPPVAVIGRWTIALGGLSECGKSTAGDHLQHEHGFTRLKIGYLLDCGAARHGVTDVYALPAAEQAELLVLELDRYAAAHRHQPHFSIESLHSYDLAYELAKLLGSALTTVYLDVCPAVRRRRGTRGPADVDERDAVKRSRGADRIRDIADVVIDNNRSAVDLGHTLDRLIRGRFWPALRPRVVVPADLGLPEHLTEFLDRMLEMLTHPDSGVDLVAVTGSGARGEYRDGWSDLDVLIIAAPAALPRISDALRAGRNRLGNVKLGLTVITLGECRTGALTSRLLYTVAAIASGALPALWASPKLLLPAPDVPTVVTRTRHDGAAAAMDLRRILLCDPVDVRATYKAAALLAKIVLRCEGQTRPGDAEALEAFTELAGLPTPAVPPLDATAATALAGRVLTWWLTSLEAAA